MKNLSSFRRLQFLIAAFLALYSVVAIVGDNYAKRKEYFPVFSWSLFSRVPAERSTYELYIHRVDETSFEEPVNFYDLPEYFAIARQNLPTIAKSARSIGRSIKNGSETLTADQAVFEAQLLDDHALVEYEIVRVVFRPLERWRHGNVDRYLPIGRFVARKNP